jgi:ethanolamine utilization protein EutA
MAQEILSAGIDLGTTTSQVIFSRIVLENISYTAIPEVRVQKKDVLYRSPIRFTPLTAEGRIDIPAIRAMLAEEYEAAGIRREDIATGAVIITGETARKENADEAAEGLSSAAGDFVVAAAGPDLESALAGCGAGAADASKSFPEDVVNFDIGGGTTNAAVFRDGVLVDAFALDIGGRLVRIDEADAITYVSPRIVPLIKELGASIAAGARAEASELKKLTDAFAAILRRIATGQPLSATEDALFLGHGTEARRLPCVMFSGGVAECIYGEKEDGPMALENVRQFGDIGPLLGQSIRKAFSEAQGIRLLTPREKIRATVIGAGSYSVRLSGSTVIADDSCVPLKNVPVLRLTETDDLGVLRKAYQRMRRMYPMDAPVAISFAGQRSPDYATLKALSETITSMTEEDEGVLLVLVEEDFAKALGMMLRQRANGRKVICLDRIHAAMGDYVDIGRSVAGIVPVVVKTLIFKS